MLRQRVTQVRLYCHLSKGCNYQILSQLDPIPYVSPIVITDHDWGIDMLTDRFRYWYIFYGHGDVSGRPKESTKRNRFDYWKIPSADCG